MKKPARSDKTASPGAALSVSSSSWSATTGPVPRGWFAPRLLVERNDRARPEGMVRAETAQEHDARHFRVLDGASDGIADGALIGPESFYCEIRRDQHVRRLRARERCGHGLRILEVRDGDLRTRVTE